MPPKLNLPNNYYILPQHANNPATKEWEIADKNIPGTYSRSDFPHRSVARIDLRPPAVWYWPAEGEVGDRVECDSLAAAVAHLEMMVGLGMVGHGYRKGMLDE